MGDGGRVVVVYLFGDELKTDCLTNCPLEITSSPSISTVESDNMTNTI